MTTISDYSIIKKVLIVLPFYLFTFLPLTAQNYTQQIQKKEAGKGTVTIHQSADIDELVNSAELAPQASSTSSATSANTLSATGTGMSSASRQGTTATSLNSSGSTIDDPSDAPVDLTKKIMRGGYKVNGYRVQAFAGGNSRKDRLQAERIGNEIKMQYANTPVYVHFYSPRWICRVGNYRTYEEAHQMLLSLRRLGYNQATIVKGKITVASY